MPYRLRIRFPAQQFLRLQADRGAFAWSGVASILRYTPSLPQGGTDGAWELVSAGYTGNDTRAGAEEPFHHDAEFLDSTGEAFLSWRTPLYGAGTNEGTFMFSPVTGLWRRTNTEPTGIDSSGYYRALGQRENYAMCYDPDNESVWISPGSPAGIMPVLVASRYDIATDIFYPVPTANFVIVNGRTFMGYYGGRVYCWRPEGFKYYDIATTNMVNLTAPTAMQLYITSGTNTDLRLCHQSQYGVNRDQKYLWNIDINCDLWKCDLTATTPTFVKTTTTGSKPQTPYGVPVGMACAIDEYRNKLVGYISKPTVNAAYDTGTVIGKTWVLDLATYEWSLGPSVAAGDTVPDSGSYHVQGNMLRMVYDRQRAQCLLLFPRDQSHEVWAFASWSGGTFESFDLPVSSGSTYGVNYYAFPFVANDASKNFNLAYCPDTGRLYVSGGDSGAGSNTYGIWSMSMADGSWRLESGTVATGAWPYAQPTGYQDNCLLAWMPSRSKFLFGFHTGKSYETENVSDNWQYARGVWTFDPAMYPDPDAWVQDLTLFPNFEAGSTGCQYGGVYDPTTDAVYAFGDNIDGGGYAMRKYDIATWALTSIAYNLARAGATAAGFARAGLANPGPVILGRYIYTVGYFDNGLNVDTVPKLWRWGIDTQLLEILADPPAVHADGDGDETKLETSNGKVVWFRRGGPDGAISNIYLYNPSTNTWSDDVVRPTYGNFIANASCSLPDGRIALSGGYSGLQQTHLWLYTAP